MCQGLARSRTPFTCFRLQRSYRFYQRTRACKARAFFVSRPPPVPLIADPPISRIYISTGGWGGGDFYFYFDRRSYFAPGRPFTYYSAISKTDLVKFVVLFSLASIDSEGYLPISPRVFRKFVFRPRIYGRRRRRFFRHRIIFLIAREFTIYIYTRSLSINGNEK